MREPFLGFKMLAIVFLDPLEGGRRHRGHRGPMGSLVFLATEPPAEALHVHFHLVHGHA